MTRQRLLARIASGSLPIIATAGLLLVLLILMGEAAHGSERFDELYSLLLILNALGLATLIGLIGWNLYDLLKQRRHAQPGARLTLRLLVLFAVLSVTPVLVVYYFSLQFLNDSIDSWFDVRIEKALDDALELSRTALGERMRERLNQTERMALELDGSNIGNVAATLDDARRLSGAFELALVDLNGRVIASSNINPAAVVPSRPSDNILFQVGQTGSYINLEPIQGSGLFIRVAILLRRDLGGSLALVLHALYPVTESLGALADSVQDGYADYRELAYLRKPLKLSFILTLSIVLLLSLFTAVWAAFHSARRVVAPLRHLAQGTHAVARGELETHLPQSTSDEIGFLVESFNDMTAALRRAHDETRRSQAQLEAQRRYLETVLATLSTGVITVDHDDAIVTCNDAATTILGVEAEALIGRHMDQTVVVLPNLAPLFDAMQGRHGQTTETGPGQEVSNERFPGMGRHHTQDRAHWRQQIGINAQGKRKIIIASGARLSGTVLPTSAADAPQATERVGPGGPLPDPTQDVAAPSGGQVVVFDDVTTLVEAQRDAAWSEVARRLAHEIKNPLTPIQLSAERLRHKYLDMMTGKDRETMDRLTRTIVQQVDGLKGMVNAFSEYARMPTLESAPLRLNDLVKDVAELYQADSGNQVLRLELQHGMPALVGDSGRIRQVLHNLIKNAREASADNGTEIAHITVRTTLISGSEQDPGRRWIELSVEDQGRGFDDDIVERVFEPYVTTKSKGTGLGLAIVKKIMEEHGGLVQAQNLPTGGARVIARFPVAELATAGLVHSAEDSVHGRSETRITPAESHDAPDAQDGKSRVDASRPVHDTISSTR
ncbi:MAG: HAMP domain-containing protein [Gammaproteobacteria bacterium]|nr:HAMP domain-containing protein [Gammaproteobacteria bacterium]